jgi:hypothetical protein
MGWVVNATPRPLYPLERSGTIVQEAEWASEPVWTGAENLASTGIWTVQPLENHYTDYAIPVPQVGVVLTKSV